MTGLLLTCLLGLSPGVQLADSQAQRHIRLVAYDPYYNMGKDDLLAELSKLDANNPSLVTPVVMLGIGVAFFIGAAIGFAIVDTSYVAAGVGVLCGIGAAVFIIVGAVMLGIRLVARARYTSDVAAVQRRLDELQRNPGTGPELPPPPPPPPPPPGAGYFNPAADVVVAVF